MRRCETRIELRGLLPRTRGYIRLAVIEEIANVESRPSVARVDLQGALQYFDRFKLKREAIVGGEPAGQLVKLLRLLRFTRFFKVEREKVRDERVKAGSGTRVCDPRQYVGSFDVEPGIAVPCRKLEVRVRSASHAAAEGLQRLVSIRLMPQRRLCQIGFVGRPEIQRRHRIHPARGLKRFRRSTQFPQQCGLQVKCFRIQAVSGDRALHEPERFREVRFARTQFREREVGSAAPGQTPGGPVKRLRGRPVLPLCPQYDTQVVEGLAVLRHGVPGCGTGDRAAELLLGLAVHAAPAIKDAEGGIAAVVTRIPLQALLVVRVGLAGRVVHLLEPQPGKIELIGALDLSRRSGVLLRDRGGAPFPS